MADDMKLILRELEKINQRMDDMYDGLNGKMNAMHDDLNGKIIDLQKENTKIQLLLENDISKKIDLIGEGHDFLKMKVNEALKMEEKWEGMGLEQINQRMELNKVKDYLGIA